MTNKTLIKKADRYTKDNLSEPFKNISKPKMPSKRTTATDTYNSHFTQLK